MDRLTKVIVNGLIDNGIVQEEKRQIYEYGVGQILFTSLNFVVFLIIGIMSDSIISISIFLACYMFIRVYAGGYHAKTKVMCFSLSNLMILIVVVLNQYLQDVVWSHIIMLVIGGGIVYYFGPVETANKPLDNQEVTVYKKKLRQILGGDVILFVGSLVLNLKVLSFSISLSLVVVSIMLVSGILDTRIQRKTA